MPEYQAHESTKFRHKWPLSPDEPRRSARLAARRDRLQLALANKIAAHFP
jgi:hypothetical protein